MSERIRWRDDDSVASDEDSGTHYDHDYDGSSYSSKKSYSTAQTTYSAFKPPLQRHDTCFGRVESHDSGRDFDFDEPRASVETYASTEPSELEFDDDDGDDDEFAFELVDDSETRYQSDAIPATPQDFAEFFPSSRRLSIHHDDSTIDGNMNLRVDTQVQTDFSAEKQNLTLFHLKMNDLRDRNFSLRRYCRESGREVCNSVRKRPSPVHRPGFPRSFSAAVASMKRTHGGRTTYDQQYHENNRNHDFVFHNALDNLSVKAPSMTNTSSHSHTNSIQLEFSNYAHVDVKRKGNGPRKGYQFEYWGHAYTWRRTTKYESNSPEVSYHLSRDDRTEALAHIIPIPLTRAEVQEERLKGGWVPPCSMWITDHGITNGPADVADVVVATGLIALVDDTIKRRWHSRGHRQVLLPLVGNASFFMERIGPKRLIDEVFNRRPLSRSSAMGYTRSG